MTSIICTSQVNCLHLSQSCMWVFCTCIRRSARSTDVHVCPYIHASYFYDICACCMHKHANVFIDYIMLLSIVLCYTVHSVHVYVHNTFMLTTSKCCVYTITTNRKHAVKPCVGLVAGWTGCHCIYSNLYNMLRYRPEWLGRLISIDSLR